jgi:hypothetical protein
MWMLRIPPNEQLLTVEGIAKRLEKTVSEINALIRKYRIEPDSQPGYKINSLRIKIPMEEMLSRPKNKMYTYKLDAWKNATEKKPKYFEKLIKKYTGGKVVVELLNNIIIWHITCGYDYNTLSAILKLLTEKEKENFSCLHITEETHE